MKPFRKRVSVVVVDQQQVLIVCRDAMPPYVGKVHELPGGGIDDGQTAESAVSTECLEEVGIIVDRIHRLPSLVHRAPFPTLRKGEGTAVQIARRKLFSGVESVAYFARFVREATEHERPPVSDAAPWFWKDFNSAIDLLKRQLTENQNHGMRGVFEHSLDAVVKAKIHAIAGLDR
jgi:ADP-ribose pyrophosphatase YjhB (NUDIX family)